MKNPMSKIRAERFCEALAEAPFGPAELARRLGLDNPQNVTNWQERGVSGLQAPAVAKELNVNVDWLNGKNVAKRQITYDTKPRGEPLYVLEPLSPWDDSTPLEEDELELRLYKEVELSSGPGSLLRTEIREVSSGPKLRFSRYSMRTAGVEPENAVFATNTGNSNAPLLLHGAAVGIDKGMTRIVEGELYALDHDGQLRIKFLQRLPGGGIRLHSFNHAEFPDEDYDADQVLEQRITILGRLFWWSTLRPMRGQPLI